MIGSGPTGGVRFASPEAVAVAPSGAPDPLVALSAAVSSAPVLVPSASEAAVASRSVAA